MHRFIDLGEQRLKGVREFAFLDTVSRKFIDFAGIQTFGSQEDFVFWAEQSGRYIEQYLALIPDWVPEYRDG